MNPLRRLPPLLVAVAAAGCLTPRPAEPPTAAEAPPTDPAPPPPGVVPAGFPPPDLPQKPAAAPRHVLVLSGGGAYGAYTAGVLNGWTRTGERPQFDVVTGVSTGALIAPLAFLGPKYDPQMQKFYTEVRQRDVFVARAWATVPFRDAFASTAPLRKILDEHLTADVMAELAAAHRAGRRLYVGTTHLDTRRFVSWDITAIAADGGQDARRLILDLLLASCAVPGVFPPVPVEVVADGLARTELHADGGAACQLFLPPGVLPPAAAGPKPTVYVVVASKWYPDPAPVKPRVLKVLQASVQTYTHAHTRADVANLFHQSKAAGAGFHVTALRAGCPLEESSIEFDQAMMNRLFAEGVQVGMAGPGWDAGPPERGPGDAGPPRGGVRFRTDRP